MNTDFIDKTRQVWTKMTKDGIFNPNILESAIDEELHNVFHIGSFYYDVVDNINSKLYFVSPKIKNVLGYDTKEIDMNFLFSKIHPNDQANVEKSQEIMVNFFSSLSSEKINRYKVSFDYRILNSSGDYIRLLNQLIVLQCDHQKKVLCTFRVQTDITNIKTDNESRLNFIGLKGEPSFNNWTAIPSLVKDNELFSKREKEVLHYLLKGKESEEISEILSISKHTVNTHRKNMLAKTKSKNTLALINKIMTDGLLKFYKILLYFSVSISEELCYYQELLQ